MLSVEKISSMMLLALLLISIRIHLVILFKHGNRQMFVSFLFKYLLIETYFSKDFGEPHDLALSQDGKHLFVATIRPNRLQIFNISSF